MLSREEDLLLREGDLLLRLLRGEDLPLRDGWLLLRILVWTGIADVKVDTKALAETSIRPIPAKMASLRKYRPGMNVVSNRRVAMAYAGRRRDARRRAGRKRIVQQERIAERRRAVNTERMAMAGGVMTGRWRMMCVSCRCKLGSRGIQSTRPSTGTWGLGYWWKALHPLFCHQRPRRLL